FPGNDLVGTMFPSAVRRLVREFSLKPGERAVVLGADERGLEVVDDLLAAGVEVARVVDLRETHPRRIEAKGSAGRVRALVLDDEEEIACDLVVATGGRQPAYSLLAQAGARVEFEPELGVLVPRDLPVGVEAVGGVTG